MTAEIKKVTKDLLAAVSGYDVETSRSLLGENNEYKQHNPNVPDGSDAVLFGLIPTLKKAGTKVVTHRIIAEDDMVVAHNTWTNVNAEAFGASEMISFDVFRVKNGKNIEHWDNLIAVKPPNPSGRTQVDGATDIIDLDKTTENKKIVKDFVDIVLINGEGDKITDYISTETYIQHNPDVADGLDGCNAAIKAMVESGMVKKYNKCHFMIAEGNFVMTACEGKIGDTPTAFYDMFRLAEGKIVEHWDVIESIPPKEDMKNNNGKF